MLLNGTRSGSERYLLQRQPEITRLLTKTPIPAARLARCGWDCPGPITEFTEPITPPPSENTFPTVVSVCTIKMCSNSQELFLLEQMYTFTRKGASWPHTVRLRSKQGFNFYSLMLKKTPTRINRLPMKNEIDNCSLKNNQPKKLPTAGCKKKKIPAWCDGVSFSP